MSGPDYLVIIIELLLRFTSPHNLSLSLPPPISASFPISPTAHPSTRRIHSTQAVFSSLCTAATTTQNTVYTPALTWQPCCSSLLSLVMASYSTHLPPPRHTTTRPRYRAHHISSRHSRLSRHRRPQARPISLRQITTFLQLAPPLETPRQASPVMEHR